MIDDSDFDFDELPDEIPVKITNLLEQTIADAFLLYDYAENKTAESRNIPMILWGLGCIPTNADIADIIFNCNDLKSGPFVHLANFLPYVCPLIMEHKMKPKSPAELLHAFKCLDPDDLGYLTFDFMEDNLQQEDLGEPLDDDEFDTMMATAYDQEDKNIPYEYYVNQLKYVPKPEDDIYLIADAVKEANQPKPEMKRRITGLEGINMDALNI